MNYIDKNISFPGLHKINNNDYIEYKIRNSIIIDELISGKITSRECLTQMNKNLGTLLVKLTEK